MIYLMQTTTFNCIMIALSSLIVGLLLGSFLQRLKPKQDTKPPSKPSLKLPTKPLPAKDNSISGTIRLFKPEKGYGFITFDGDNDIFFHIKSWTETSIQPETGTQVTFTIGEDDQKKGKSAAMNIKKKK